MATLCQRLGLEDCVRARIAAAGELVQRSRSRNEMQVTAESTAIAVSALASQSQSLTPPRRDRSAKGIEANAVYHALAWAGAVGTIPLYATCAARHVRSGRPEAQRPY